MNIDLHMAKSRRRGKQHRVGRRIYGTITRGRGRVTSEEANERFLKKEDLPKAFLLFSGQQQHEKPPPSMNIIIIIIIFPCEPVCSHLILILFSFFPFPFLINFMNTHKISSHSDITLQLFSSPTTTACTAHCLITVTHLLWPWCTGDRLLWDSFLLLCLWLAGDGDRADDRCRPFLGGDLDLDIDRGIPLLTWCSGQTNCEGITSTLSVIFLNQLYSSCPALQVDTPAQTAPVRKPRIRLTSNCHEWPIREARPFMECTSLCLRKCAYKEKYLLHSRQFTNQAMLSHPILDVV